MEEVGIAGLQRKVTQNYTEHSSTPGGHMTGSRDHWNFGIWCYLWAAGWVPIITVMYAVPNY